MKWAMKKAFFAPLGTALPWRSDTAQGTVTAARYGWAVDGALCREYRQTIIADNAAHEGSGKTCWKPGGSWRYAGVWRPSAY